MRDGRAPSAPAHRSTQSRQLGRVMPNFGEAKDDRRSDEIHHHRVFRVMKSRLELAALLYDSQP